MRRVIIPIGLLIVSGWAGLLHADIYVWTDEKDVKHFTNYAPPEQARILMKTEELPYDEAADRERMAADRRQVKEQQWREIEERQAMLAYEQQDAERRLAEANRQAQETLREAEQLLEEAEQLSDDYGFRYRNYLFYVPRYRYYYPGYHHKPYPHRFKNKRHPHGKYDHRPNASRWTKPDRGRDFSARQSPGGHHRTHGQWLHDRNTRTDGSARFEGHDSTKRYSTGRFRANGRSGLSGFKSYRP